MISLKDSEQRMCSHSALVRPDMIDDICETIASSASSYNYDQYRRYPATTKIAWEQYLVTRFKQLSGSDEWFFLYSNDDEYPHLLGCKISNWDYEHFGIRMASLAIVICGDGEHSRLILTNMIDDCLTILREHGIEQISARLNGDNIAALQALSSHGFQYFENVIWPVTSCKNLSVDANSSVKLLAEHEIDTVVEIALTSTFQRSHFHCDTGFEKNKVDSMHAKWIRTAWDNNDPIAVIESNGEIAGFFAFQIDHQLSEALGYKYGRMKNLAIDIRARGSNLGATLFSGTISLMKEMGVQFVDSGYSSKNHISAKLHMKHSFYSVYEEVTFHLWP